MVNGFVLPEGKLIRTIPTAVTTGFSSSLAQFWVVKVQGSGGNTYYWTTASKNIDSTPQTLVLKETSAGSALTYDAGMIAKTIDGHPEDGIGQTENGIHVYDGGGLGFVGDIDLTILNQERFDETINANEVNLENRPVELFWGFIPAGSTPTVVIEDDMLLRWAGVVDDVLDQDYTEFIIRCSDASLLSYEEIPTILVESETFPDAPKENLGKPIPLLYGDFEESDIDLARDYMRVSPAPTIKTNDITNQFYLANHEIHTFGLPYWFSSNNNLFGSIGTAPTETNDSDGARFVWAVGPILDLVVSFMAQLKDIQKATAAATFVEDAVDDSDTSFASFTGTAEEFMGALPRPTNDGALCDASGGVDAPLIRVWVRFGSITGSGSELFAYIDANGNVEDFATGYSEADANSRTNGSLITVSKLTWDDLGTFKFGFKRLSNLSLITVKNLSLEYFVRVARLAYVGRPVWRGSGRRRIR